MDHLKKLNAQVLGVSTDDIASQKQFAEKEKLNFRLLSDADKKVAAAYGVLMDNGYAKRVTFIIDPKGIVRYIFLNVDVSQHADEVAKVLKELRAGKT